MAQVSHMMFYPLKSAAGIEVENATLTPSGLVVGNYADHQYLVVRAQPDEKGVHEFITQRDRRDKKDKPQGFAALSQIKPRLSGGRLFLTWKYQNPVELPAVRAGCKSIPVRVWEHTGYAVDQGDGVAEWLTEHLQWPVRLVKAAGQFERMTRQDYLPNKNPIRFQDAYSIHWVLEESVDELSRIAGEEIPWQSFRPQLVVKGMESGDEHQIHSGEIGGVPFVDPKPCDRCPVTNVDQETGEVKVGRALTHLAKGRRWRNGDWEVKVIFGENMLPLGEGKISLGDELKVTSLRDPPLVYGEKV